MLLLRYEYGQITGGVSADDRQHNADSMALLGCGKPSRFQIALPRLTQKLMHLLAWYLSPYYWQDGQAVLLKKANRPAPP